MVRKISIEEKTEEKALSKLTDFNLNIDEVIYLKEIQKGSLLKSDKIILTVIEKKEIEKLINNYLNKLSSFLNIDINAEIIITNENIKVMLNTSNPSILIGRDAKMLNSIQLLLKKHLEINLEMNIKLYIDIENYKQKKLNQLENNVEKIIREVINTKIDVKLDDMNSYERRLVHNLVAKYENLSSESDGIEPHRYVVIKYVER